VAYDFPAGTPAWSFQLGGPTSQTGAPPQVLGGEETLLVIVSRNFGYTLQTIDPETGRALWPDEILLGSDSVSTGSVAWDQNSVYVTTRSTLRSLAREDGRLLWTKAFPSIPGGWLLLRVPSALLAWPAAVRRTDCSFRWLGNSTEWSVAYPPEDRPGRGIPLLVLDPRTGKLVQRLNFQSWLRTQGKTVMGQSWGVIPTLRACRRLDSQKSPIVQWTGSGILIAWFGQAWNGRLANE
jgi:outer membrane protein assembly factor BamB